MTTLHLLICATTLLSIFSVIYVYTAVKIANQHNHIVDTYSRLFNEYEVLFSKFNTTVESIHQQIKELETTMKADSYKDISGINIEVKRLGQELTSLKSQTNQQMEVLEANIRQALNDMRNLAQQIRVLRENPGMTSRY
jgi:DNA repair exonuclease SbcCD ATPase subunit